MTFRYSSVTCSRETELSCWGDIIPSLSLLDNALRCLLYHSVPYIVSTVVPQSSICVCVFLPPVNRFSSGISTRCPSLVTKRFSFSLSAISRFHDYQHEQYDDDDQGHRSGSYKQPRLL